MIKNLDKKQCKILLIVALVLFIISLCAIVICSALVYLMFLGVLTGYDTLIYLFISITTTFALGNLISRLIGAIIYVSVKLI